MPPTLRSRQCPNCNRYIGPNGHRCRTKPPPIRTTRPTNFTALVNQARNQARNTQLTLDLEIP